MTPLKALKAATSEFQKRNLSYCLIGGHAASLYRNKPRVTKDVDFAIAAEPSSDAKELAKEVIEAIGLKPVLGFIPAAMRLAGQSGKVCLITSEPKQGDLTGIIDILLAELPWVEKAVERAQKNMIDLGFSKVPVITPEDLVIAKCYALSGSPDRFQDLDDLKEIFTSLSDLDVSYIKKELKQLNISIPEVIIHLLA